MTTPQSFAAYAAGWRQSLPTDPQRQLFDAELARAQKSPQTAILLALFLGGIGMHRFYLNDLWGVVYLVFFWTFIPLVVSLIEAIFVLHDRVETYNKHQAHLIATRIRAYTPV